MELTKKFKAQLVGKTVEVKAVYVTDPKPPHKGYYMVPSGEILRLLVIHTAYFPKYKSTMTGHGMVAVEFVDDENEITGQGSCLISAEAGPDPVGIATRRAILNFAFLTCAFDDVYDELRKLNGQTLDLATSDRLNQSLEKLF